MSETALVVIALRVSEDDAAEDGYIEEHAWVACDLAATPTEAVAALVREWPDGHPLEYDDMYPSVGLRADGRKEWMVAVWRDYDDESAEPTEYRGTEAETRSALDEYLRFEKCEPYEEGAREWWIVERIELCGKWLEPDEMAQCGLDPDHEGSCVSNQESERDL